MSLVGILSKRIKRKFHLVIGVVFGIGPKPGVVTTLLSRLLLNIVNLHSRQSEDGKTSMIIITIEEERIKRKIFWMTHVDG